MLCLFFFFRVHFDAVLIELYIFRTVDYIDNKLNKDQIKLPPEYLTNDFLLQVIAITSKNFYEI